MRSRSLSRRGVLLCQGARAAEDVDEDAGRLGQGVVGRDCVPKPQQKMLGPVVSHYLEADGQVVRVLANRAAQSRQAQEVAEEHISHEAAEDGGIHVAREKCVVLDARGGDGRRRRDNHIDLLEDVLEHAHRVRPDLLSSNVVAGRDAGRQRKADARLLAQLGKVLAIEALHERGHLAQDGEAVGARDDVQHGNVNLDDLHAAALKGLLQRAAAGAHNLGRGVLKVRLEDADANLAQAFHVGEAHDVWRRLDGALAHLLVVSAGHDSVGQGHVLDVRGHGADVGDAPGLVGARRDAGKAGLQAEDAVERGRVADRASAVGADGDREQAGSRSGGRARAGAAGVEVEAVRVARDAAARVVAGHAEANLMHVEPAHQQRALLAQEGDRQGILCCDGPDGAEEGGAVARAVAAHGNLLLDTDGHAVERADRVAVLVALCRCSSLLEQVALVELRDGVERLGAGVGGGDSGNEGAGDIRGGHVAAPVGLNVVLARPVGKRVCGGRAHDRLSPKICDVEGLRKLVVLLIEMVVVERDGVKERRVLLELGGGAAHFGKLVFAHEQSDDGWANHWHPQHVRKDGQRQAGHARGIERREVVAAVQGKVIVKL
eukprot:m.103823 g.103823  ORF g.103823 m.103823 type:complete len:604 (-) comp15730_c0_seq5:110-1921(-)